VLEITSQGTGLVGSACAGDTFTISVPDGNGTYNITPLSDPGNQIPFSGFCDIGFTFNVNRAPSVDRSANPGLQAESDAIARGTLPDSSKTFATGPNLVTVTFVCAVKVDKQISCDNAATAYKDLGLVSANEDGTNGCIGKFGASGVKVQYQFSNVGTVGVKSCTISESNTNLSLQIAGGDLAAGATSSFFQGTKTGTALECSAARSGNGQTEPDQADLSCTCDVGTAQGDLGPPLATALDNAKFECCGVQIDKQITCTKNGVTTTIDVGFGVNPTDVCDGTLDSPATIKYAARANPSNTDTLALSSCVISDLQTGPGGGPLSGVPSGFVLPLSLTANTTVDTCTSSFAAKEPNTASIDCTCGGTNLAPITVSDSDSASLTCTGIPGIRITKECQPVSPGNFTSSVNVTNIGTVPLANCQITDTLRTRDGVATSCADLTGANSTGIPMTPATIASLPVSTTSVPSTGVINGLTFTACNTAAVDCDAVGGQAIHADTSAQCTVSNGCFTRTPGYWGTHPQVTSQVLPVRSCGLDLTTVDLQNLGPFSAIQDMCYGGKDTAGANGGSGTSPQEMNLIFQCAAAALNLKASGIANLGCNSEFDGIEGAFRNCCGDTGVCATGQNLAGDPPVTFASCNSVLNVFNNRFDAAPFPGFLTLGLAQSQTCRDVSNDGKVNTGAGRTYPPK
jgi:hypothetical protein